MTELYSKENKKILLHASEATINCIRVFARTRLYAV